MSSYRRNLWNVAFLALAAVAVSGCQQLIDTFAPPQMRLGESEIRAAGLGEPAPVNPALVRMQITNGAGDVIYQGNPFLNPLTYDPKDPRFDGTLHITRTYSDGTVKSQNFTYQRGKPIRLSFNEKTRQYELTESPLVIPRFYFGLDPSYNFLNRPDTQIVRQDEGGKLAGFITADNESNNPAFNGRLGLKINQPFLGLGKRWGVEFGGSYFSSVAKKDMDVVPAGTGDLAVLGPLPGGGVNFGNRDITGLRYRSDYTTWEDYIWFWKDYDEDLWNQVVDFHSFIGVDFGKDEDDQELSGSVPDVPVDFMSANAIDNWYYGPVGGFETRWRLLGQTYPKLNLKAGAFGKLLVNDLSAKRMITLTNGLNGTDELNNSEVTLGGGAKLGLDYMFSNMFSLRLAFEYEYANKTPVINVNQDTGEATVNAEGANLYKITIGARYEF